MDSSRVSGLTLEEQHTVGIAWTVCSAMSLSCVSLVLVCMLILQQYKQRHHQLVFTLFLSAFGTFLVSFLSRDTANEYSAFCKTTGFFFQLFWNANILWVLAISTNLYRSVVLLEKLTGHGTRSYHWLIWSWCFLCAFAPLTTHSYGWSGVYCWLKTDDVGIIWRMATIYYPMIVYVLYIVVLYALMIRAVLRLRSLQFAEGRPPSGLAGDGTPRSLVAKSFVKYMVLYPVFFLLSYSCAIVNRYYTAVHGHTTYPLLMAHSIGVGLMGVFYSVTFGLLSLRRYRDIWARLQTYPETISTFFRRLFSCTS